MPPTSGEHAIRLLKALGIPVILAESFARSFYRNCINLGMPALEELQILESVSASAKAQVLSFLP